MRFERVPYISRGNIFIVMSINIPGPSHLTPGNSRMTSFHRVWQAPRGLGNDLQTTRYRINGSGVVSETLIVQAGGKLSR